MLGELLGISTTGKYAPVENPPLVLVGCSGGPDSLALAGVASFFASRGEIRVGAVVVDHQMQTGSAEVAQATARTLRDMGLEPVQVRTVNVEEPGIGPEAAARAARFAALDQAAEELSADAVLLGHTMDDQAESVLLGLARGSGTRSLAGIRERRGKYLRPFLGLRREETLAICEALELAPWRDPTNQDPRYLRVRVRNEVLPFLSETLGQSVSESLARTATILGHDADFLDELAAKEYAALAQKDPANPSIVTLSDQALRDLPPALRLRVIALAVVSLGGQQPSQERLLSAQALLDRKGSAGPVQMAGKISAYRISRSRGAVNGGQASVANHRGAQKSVLHVAPSYGKLEFKRSS